MLLGDARCRLAGSRTAAWRALPQAGRQLVLRSSQDACPLLTPPCPALPPRTCLPPQATRPLAAAVHRAVVNVGADGGALPDPGSANQHKNKRGQAAGDWDVSQMAPKLKEQQYVVGAGWACFVAWEGPAAVARWLVAWEWRRQGMQGATGTPAGCQAQGAAVSGPAGLLAFRPSSLLQAAGEGRPPACLRSWQCAHDTLARVSPSLSRRLQAAGDRRRRFCHRVVTSRWPALHPSLPPSAGSRRRASSLVPRCGTAQTTGWAPSAARRWGGGQACVRGGS